jgi:hypothetical protein
MPGQAKHGCMHCRLDLALPGSQITDQIKTQRGVQMTISPEDLAKLVAIPEEAAKLILEPQPNMDEQQIHGKLLNLLQTRLMADERKWIWEIHKNCDQLIHQRLASFTAAQAMTLASFSVLTVARFNAATGMAEGRLELLDKARVWVIGFGIFLAAVGWLVTYPMFKRLQYLNQNFLFRDKIYLNYFKCIESKESSWGTKAEKGTIFPYSLYKSFIPLWLPIAEGVFWLVLLRLLVVGLSLQPAPSQPLLGIEKLPVEEKFQVCRYQENNPQFVALGLDALKLPLCR